MTSHILNHQTNVTKLLSEIGITVTETKELPYGVQLFLSDNKSKCKINLYYSKKKGNSIVQAGGDKKLLEIVLQCLNSAAQSKAKEYNKLEIPTGFRIGSDEAGKGDYFGPLVVAAVGCEQKTAEILLKIGVSDSKKLSNAKVKELYEKLTVMSGVKYSVCSISPQKYNSLFIDFKAIGKNSLDILASAHAEVLNELSKINSEFSAIIIDKFCNMNRLSPWLNMSLSKVELRVRAEDSEVVVAAASIIARGVYLSELSRLSLKYGVTISPGAGHEIDMLASEAVNKNGEGVLNGIAKEHFANTKRIVDCS